MCYFALNGTDHGSLTRVSLGLPDPVPQRLMMHAKLLGQAPDHRLRVRPAIQAHSTLT